MAKIPEHERDDTPISFGKYKGMTPNDLSEIDPKYIIWMYENFSGSCSKDLYMNCEELVQDIKLW
jgi:uncharacterized protein (DUF3820 family)